MSGNSMMNNITIENATREDFEMMQMMFRRMFDIFSEDQDVEYPYKENGERYLKERIEQGIALVAKLDNSCIGFLTGSIEKALDFKVYDKYGFIHNMFVSEEYREMGIGKRLVEAFVNKCKARGIQYVQADSDANQSLINFYTGNGFKVCGVSYKMKLS